MCDYANDCSNWRPLCREVTYERPNEPRCFDKVSLKAQVEPVAVVPCSVGVMPYAEYSDEQLKLIARSDSSTLCEYLRTETVFDADRIAGCLAIANIAAADELKRRAKA
ncbi:hypothetical protein KAR91_24450 [Candidatus Pacearchaeota archaeon]|nr:hypothetical protein [Candidatus Pacearchaeota archaeon]